MRFFNWGTLDADVKPLLVTLKLEGSLGNVEGRPCGYCSGQGGLGQKAMEKCRQKADKLYKIRRAVCASAVMTLPKTDTFRMVVDYHDLVRGWCLIYVDDDVVWASNAKQLLERLELVLKRFVMTVGLCGGPQDRVRLSDHPLVR